MLSICIVSIITMYPAKLFIYETNPTSDSANILKNTAENLFGLETTIFGNNDKFNGFSSKYQSFKPYLSGVSDDTLVILADGRDVLINHDARFTSKYYQRVISDTFSRITKTKNQVVVSTEAQCCVAAMTHFKPGEMFDDGFTRTSRACSSGANDCKWLNNGMKSVWESVMHARAKNVTGSIQEDVFPNAGLMMGLSTDVYKLIEKLSLYEFEDDQAVLTDFIYRFPDFIVLDYNQELFGNNRWTLGQHGCMFKSNGMQMVHTTTLTTPAFLHSPGKYYECSNNISRALHQVVPDRRRLSMNTVNYNYNYNYNYDDSVSSAEFVVAFDNNVRRRLLAVNIVDVKSAVVDSYELMNITVPTDSVFVSESSPPNIEYTINVVEFDNVTSSVLVSAANTTAFIDKLGVTLGVAVTILSYPSSTPFSVPSPSPPAPPASPPSSDGLTDGQVAAIIICSVFIVIVWIFVLVKFSRDTSFRPVRATADTTQPDITPTPVDSNVIVETEPEVETTDPPTAPSPYSEIDIVSSTEVVHTVEEDAKPDANDPTMAEKSVKKFNPSIFPVS